MLRLQNMTGSKRNRRNRSCWVTLCDPIDDIKVMMDYENNLKLIMKNGKVYRNILK